MIILFIINDLFNIIYLKNSSGKENWYDNFKKEKKNKFFFLMMDFLVYIING